MLYEYLNKKRSLKFSLKTKTLYKGYLSMIKGLMVIIAGVHHDISCSGLKIEKLSFQLQLNKIIITVCAFIKLMSLKVPILRRLQRDRCFSVIHGWNKFNLKSFIFEIHVYSIFQPLIWCTLLPQCWFPYLYLFFIHYHILSQSSCIPDWFSAIWHLINPNYQGKPTSFYIVWGESYTHSSLFRVQGHATFM